MAVSITWASILGCPCDKSPTVLGSMIQLQRSRIRCPKPIWLFPQIRGPILVVPIIRTIV